ncbi:60S ribosomal protein L22 [Cordyceps fumosorosea ARSEF 2679]|uniref:60S ribosomal protein L22 n=1 Tax=Cordyceps fumosorosea (strain ARSEF 2679) TaxID=1081104 RepID=A0A167R391_CORFA|nr:60S ribosomal protein L22 [Cordyceps fumosorosea ARSEF 2679]OAA58236.1 60S ribosomal protein L22 [Cordyceps fumosorosea ARSEF 2679]
MAPIAKKSGKAQKQTKKVSFTTSIPQAIPALAKFVHVANLPRAQFIINASQPASDKIFDTAAFEKFLQERIKVEGRTNNLGDDVVVQQAGEGKIEVIAHNDFSGRYLKYLTKKFLKKQQLRDWLRVVSTSRGVYELKFFNVVNDEADEDDE